MQVGSWNVNRRVGDAAIREGKFLKEQNIDIVAIQEANLNSLDLLCESAGFDWWRCGLNYATNENKTTARRLGAAVAGRGTPPNKSFVFDNVMLPERTLVCEFSDHIVCSFHAPPGVNWGIEKPRQAVKIAQWLATVDRPVWFGIDANTPEIYHPDFQQTQTHYHTGIRELNGEPGDDLLVGPNKIHGLRDAWRIYLEAHPHLLETLRSKYPAGPLATSHRTGKRKNSSGNRRRYDSIWVSNNYQVGQVTYLYDESIAAGSDHALVIAELNNSF